MIAAFEAAHHHAGHQAFRHGDNVILRRKLRKKVVKNQEGTPQNIYIKWILSEIEQEAACLELPFTLLLLVSFAIFSITYIGQDELMIVEKALTTDIHENANFAWAENFGHKNIDDVNSYADFWSWTRLGFVPLVVPSQAYGYSEGLSSAIAAHDGLPPYDVALLPTRRPFPGYQRPAPIRNDYLRYNRIIGGIRFRQQVGEISFDKCIYPGSEGVMKAYIGKSCTQMSDQEMSPDSFAAEDMDNPVREEWLLSEIEEPITLIQHVIDMEDGCTSAKAQNRTCLCRWCAQQASTHPWLSENTLRIEISFLVYNAQYSIHAMATVNYWFNRAGHIHKIIHIRSSWAGVEVREPMTLFLFLTAGTIWLLCNIYMFRTEGWEIYNTIKKSQKKWFLALFEDYMSFWNCVDWVSVAIGAAIVSMFVSMLLQMYTVTAILGQLATSATSGFTATPAEYQATIVSYYAQCSTLFDRERLFRFWICIYPSVLMMRLFKSFAAQPRLAIVTETFKKASGDIMHFFVVFSSVYFCMSVNAVLFFGQDVLDFCRLDWALFSVWRAMLGDWDWDQMSRIGREKAFVWLFLFIFLVVVILMNILISILMEAYASVKEAADNADSLFRQVWNMMRRLRETRQGKRVKLNDVAAALLADAEGLEQDMLNNTRPLLPVFRVQLDRTDGSDLGLTIEIFSNTVVVKRVNGGLAERHNDNTDLLQILEGDVIVEVNGVRDDPKAIIKEMAKNEKLSCRIRRPTTYVPMESLMQRRGSDAGKSGKRGPQLMTKQINTKRPGFLMDIVNGLPEVQAKRTLDNSQEVHNKMHGEAFSPEDLEEEIFRLCERMGTSTLCAAWLSEKFVEYQQLEAEKMKAEGAGPKKKQPKKGPLADNIRDGIAEVRMVAAERTSELAEDVASVLGEEMAVLERRQKEQQRAMSHTQESLQGLRQMIYKLDVTCDEAGKLARQLDRRRGGSKEVIHAAPYSSQASEMSDNAHARLIAIRAARGYAEDSPLHNHRFGAAVGGSRK